MPPNREGRPETPELNLPREQAESRPENDEQRQEQSVERAPARPEKSPQAAKQPALPVIPDDIPDAAVPPIAAPADDTIQFTDPHQMAKDSDHIEPEWVDKAKSVIAQTHSDPYQQKHEMSKVKAAYIRKRFGKNVKTDEAAA
jgi:hypothetical protein